MISRRLKRFSGQLVTRIKKQNKTKTQTRASHHFVCLDCAVLTVSPRKISWHGTNRHSATLLHHLHCVGKEAAPKKVNKRNLMSHQRWHTPANRKALTCVITTAVMWHFIKRGIAEQHELAPVTLSFPFPVVFPPMSPFQTCPHS